MNAPSMVPFCSCSAISVGGTPTGVAPSAATRSRTVGEAKRMRSPLKSSRLRIAFLVVCGAARLVREEHQHLDALVLGVEVFRAQLGVVQHLGADLGAADHERQVDDLGQREASRRAAVQEPGDVGLAGAREVVVRRRRAHLRRREALHDRCARPNPSRAAPTT